MIVMTNNQLKNLKAKYIREGYKLAKRRVLREQASSLSEQQSDYIENQLKLAISAVQKGDVSHLANCMNRILKVLPEEYRNLGA